MATQGRSFWVLDDLTPLRELAAAITSTSGTYSSDMMVHLFTPRDVTRGRAGAPMSEMDLALPDPLPEGAILSYAISEELQGLTLEVWDAQDRIAGRWGGRDAGGRSESGGRGARSLAAEPGFHRVFWPIRYQEDGGVKAPPGRFRVRLSWQGGSTERSFRVLPDPTDPSITLADYEEQFRVSMEVQEAIQETRDALRRLRETREQARDVIAKARTAEREVGELPELANTMESTFALLEGELTSVDDPTVHTSVQRPEGGGLDREFGSLSYHLNSGGGYGAGGTEGRPTVGALAKKQELELVWAQLKSRIETALEAETAAFNAEVARLGLVGIVIR